jgi:hypothetical protein
MQSYKLIKGTDKNIPSFEKAVSEAIDEGYVLSNDLIAKSITDSNGTQELVFLQSMVYEEDLDLDEEFFVEEEEELEN